MASHRTRATPRRNTSRRWPRWARARFTAAVFRPCGRWRRSWTCLIPKRRRQDNRVVRFLPKNRRRFWILFGLLLVLAVATIWYRHWSPKMELSTAHYTIRSTASPEQTRKVAEMVEILNTAYLRVFTNLPPATGRKLQLKLYRDRAECRRVNPWVGWAEAFYRKPYCNAYYSEDEVNPYHWMLHEATHQLNNEVAHFKLAKWVDEGLATY